MCTGLEVAALAMTALSGVGAAIGQKNQSDAAAASASYASQVADRSAKVAEWQAKDAIERGKIAREKQEMVNSQKMGTTVAALAAQGSDLSGSPADIIGDTAAANKLDEMTISSNAEREAYGFKVRAADAGSEAAFQASRSAAISSAAPLSIATTLIGTAGQVAGRWYSFKNKIPVVT